MPDQDLNGGGVVLITGASSGIGRATARHLLEAGYRVFGTSRHPVAETLDGFALLPLEVTSDASVAACVQTVTTQTAGRIDVLINNVGTGILGAAEESSAEQVKALFDVNVFGAMRMTSAVLPFMRAQQSGRILFLSSAGGVVSVPYAGYYCATKHALEAYVEALRLEVEGFGIAASIIAPGTVSTAAGDKAMQPDLPKDVYAPIRERATAEFVEAIHQGMDPKFVAAAILQVIRDANAEPRYTVGIQSWLVSLMKSIVPARLLEAGIRRVTKNP
jgi:NAD(P)-dependent dehydrogenase (short-subunit alcohol dehydrogenase family)